MIRFFGKIYIFNKKKNKDPKKTLTNGMIRENNAITWDFTGNFVRET